jgi:hypothetical protein
MPAYLLPTVCLFPHTLQQGRRRLLAASVVLVITISDSQQTAAEVQQATKVLIEAIGGPTVEALPPYATLDDLLVTLNNLVSNSSDPGSTAQQLLATVNDAIASANLTSIFSNATAVPKGECCTQEACTASKCVS